MTEKDIYKQAVDELTTGNFDQALWALVWTKAGGQENLAKARYVEARVREIKRQLRRARRAGRPRLALRVPWRLVGLTACAATFAVVNTSVARAHTFQMPPVRWDFYLIRITGYTLGLMLFPGAALLVSLGSGWSYRIAFLILCTVGCLAGTGGVPNYDADWGTPAMGYLATGVLIWLVWLGFALLALFDERRANKLPKL